MIKTAISIHRKVWGLFNYVHDDKQYNVPEHWQSHAKAVNEGKQFYDDCDGFAMTCCELMMEAGVPKQNVLFVICTTETGEGHAVAGITINDKTYILENRFPRVYDWEDRKEYKWQYFMTFDQPGKWKEIMNG